MTKLLDQAIDRVRDRPAAALDEFALLPIGLLGGADEPLRRLTPEDRAALDAADAEMTDLWTKSIPRGSLLRPVPGAGCGRSSTASPDVPRKVHVISGRGSRP